MFARLGATLAAIGFALSAHVRRASIQRHAAYSVELSNYFNIQYYGPFSFGGQTLPVIYDTGSFEIVVLSNLCGECPNLLKYNNEKSSSYADSSVELEHVFASGSAHTRKGYETVHIGEAQSPYAAEHFPIWQVMKHEISAWAKANSRFAGIVGLGHSDHVPEGYGQEGVATTTLLAALSLDSFALCLERGKPFAPGHLLFGAKNLMQSGQFQGLQVQGKSHWAVQMTELHADGVPDTQACHPSCGAIVDSGTSLIATPPEAADFVAGLQALLQPDCSNMHSLPTLRFQLDGKPVELPPAAWVWRIKTPTGTVCKAAFMPLEKSSGLGPVWILGMPFLRYHYTVFDREANEIHIARSLPNCELQDALSAAALGGDKAKKLVDVTNFIAQDYEPLEGDLQQAMIPSWALSKGHIDL